MADDADTEPNSKGIKPQVDKPATGDTGGSEIEEELARASAMVATRNLEDAQMSERNRKRDAARVKRQEEQRVLRFQHHGVSLPEDLDVQGKHTAKKSVAVDHQEVSAEEEAVIKT